MEVDPNPFAPPPATLEAPPEQPVAAPPLRPRRPVATSLALWSFVCVASAAPSFLWGLGTIAGAQYLAMSLGIAVFIILYTWGDQATQRAGWRQIPAVALTLKIGYTTRVMLSVIFPVGALLDVVCGMVSVAIVEAVAPSLRSSPDVAANFDGSVGFLGAFVITLVQGVFLNVVLLGYMTVVLGIVLAFQRQRSSL